MMIFSLVFKMTRISLVVQEYVMEIKRFFLDWNWCMSLGYWC